MGELTRCCHCTVGSLTERYKDQQLVLLADEGWISLFVIGEPPVDAEQRIREHAGGPVRWVGSFLAITDRCVC